MSKFTIEVEFDCEIQPGFVLDKEGKEIADPTENELREFIRQNQGPFVALLGNREVKIEAQYSPYFTVSKHRSGETDHAE